MLQLGEPRSARQLGRALGDIAALAPRQFGDASKMAARRAAQGSDLVKAVAEEVAPRA